MSLLDEAFEDFIFMNRAVVDDGYGGTVTEWTSGATIRGAMVYNGSQSALIAEAISSKQSYTFTCRKELELDFHDVLMSKATGKMYRITNNSDENRTPNSAGLNMRQYTAEEFKT